MSALTQHIEALNAESKAQEAVNGYAFKMESCAAYWAEMGIHTVEQWERSQLESEFSDAYKDAHGIRPRMDLSYLSMEELQAAVDQAYKDAEAAFERAKEDQKEAAERFEASVTATIENGAGDRATALRWLRDADAVSGDDDGFFEYNNGLEYGYWAKHCS